MLDFVLIDNGDGPATHFACDQDGDGVLDAFYPIEEMDNVKALFASMAGDLLELARNNLVSRIADARKACILSFSLGGLAIGLDKDTRANLTGAALGLMRDETLDHIDWEVSEGVFESVPRATILALSDASFVHVQACFSRARELTNLAIAAPDKEALAAIDITSDWPICDIA